MSGIARGLKAYPGLLRAGFAESVAYRAEFIVWMLTTTMPLVSMALWTVVARGQRLGPERLGQGDFVTYFLLALLVRLVTGSWVLWEMNREIRMGLLGQRLLRPVHPLIAYSAENLAAVPLRGMLVLPLVLGMLYFTQKSGGRLTTDPVLLLAFVVSLPGAWALTFLFMALMGTLAFFIESSLALFQFWMATYTIFSGYMVPLSLLPGWVGRLAEVLPFRYMLELPIRLAMGMPGVAEPHWAALRYLGFEYLYVVVVLLLTGLLWRLGLRRHAAFGA